VWGIDTEYTSEHISTILEVLGIDNISDTGTNFLCLCPYHDNTDSPAFAINHTTGVWYCFACDARGVLTKLIRDQRNCSVFEAGRLIKQTGNAVVIPTAEKIKRAQKKIEFVRYDGDIEGEHRAFPKSPAIDYMHGRGFETRPSSISR